MPLSSEQLDAFRHQLEQTAAETQALLSSADSTEGSITPDNAIGRLTRMEAIQAQSMGAEGKRRAEMRLNQIRRALDRINSGTYGACVECSEEIPLGRLEFMPEAPFCMDCARNRA